MTRNKPRSPLTGHIETPPRDAPASALGRISRQYGKVAKKREQLCVIQAETAQARQDYLHMRTFFEQSTHDALSSCQQHGTTSYVLRSHAVQLCSDGAALEVHSENLRNLEARAAAIQRSIARLETVIAGGMSDLTQTASPRLAYFGRAEEADEDSTDSEAQGGQ